MTVGYQTLRSNFKLTIKMLPLNNYVMKLWYLYTYILGFFSLWWPRYGWSISLEMVIKWNYVQCDGSSLVVIHLLSSGCLGMKQWFDLVSGHRAVRGRQKPVGLLLQLFCIFIRRALGVWGWDAHFYYLVLSMFGVHFLWWKWSIQEIMCISS